MRELSTIPYPLVRHAQTNPHHPAVIDGKRSISYAELDALSVRVARELHRLDFECGHRLAVAAPVSLEWIVLVHACARLGIVIVPIAADLPKRELDRVLDLIHPSRMFHDSDLYKIIDWHSARFHDTSNESMRDFDVVRINPQDIHSIILTSGTSGSPKAVCLSFANHLFSALASGINLGIHRDDRWLLNLPPYHIGGFAIVMRSAVYGTTVVVQQHSDATETLNAIETQRVTQLSLVPTTLQRLLVANKGAPFPSWIRTVLIGGGPVDHNLLAEARQTGLPVLPTYGMTETASQIATAPPGIQSKDDPRAVWPLSFIEISIRGDDGRELDPGLKGTVHVRGPMVAEGLLSAPDLMEPIVDAEGWFQTSDVGSVDTHDQLHVHGRADRVIISGGEKIHPEEIETTIGDLDGVRTAAVFGFPDSEWGERVVAAVEPESMKVFDDAAIRQILSRVLSRHKIPREIIALKTLPRTSLGKIDYRTLQDDHRRLTDNQTAVR